MRATCTCTAARSTSSRSRSTRRTASTTSRTDGSVADMSKYVGTVKKSDLEGGIWVLETDSGDRYQLHGKVGELTDGMRATVEGKVAKDMMGIGMTGPSLT